MILIISIHFDQSTSDVVQWLLSYDQIICRINERNFVKGIKVFQSQKGRQIELEIETNRKVNLKVNFNDLQSIWYRRGRFAYEHGQTRDELKDFINHDNREWHKVNEMLMSSLIKKFIIGDFLHKENNKLEVLKIAAGIGLSTPDTLITNKKCDVQRHFMNKEVINKTIGDVIHLDKNETIYNNRTILVDVNNLPEYFFPSQFQVMIEKKYELRIFYLHRKFFASAIFSQNNDQTKVDFRNYDYKKPNRIVPFNLPEIMSKKLNRLMQKLKLNTGSIDVLVDTKNEYYFLEVNPNGQFGFVSGACNYYCEKFLAETLIKAG